MSRPAAVTRFSARLTALCAATLILSATAGLAAGRYDASLRFRVLRTAHFTIYYHQREAGMAGRLAVAAERVRANLSARTGLVAPPHVHVVIVDQSDIANGWSTPVPYDLIEIAAMPPPPSSFLGHHDDWLEHGVRARVRARPPPRPGRGRDEGAPMGLRAEPGVVSRTCSCRSGRSKGSQPGPRVR